MSHMMDRSTENSDEDRASPRSNGNTASNDKTLGMLQSFRKSIKRAAEKSPLSPGSKGSKVTPKGDNALGVQPPPSPSPSTGSAVISPLASPLKNIAGLFQKKEEDDTDVDSQKSKGLTRSKTDPNMTRFSDSIMKRGTSIRRSLGFGNKKNKASRQDPLVPVTEGSAEEKKEEKEAQVEEEVEVWEEIEESYKLPELPHTPLSVMQINKLIVMEVLEEAHLNLLAMRQEFQQEQERCGEDSPMELAKKEKDLNLLYGELRSKINTIVRDSNSLPSRNKALLVPVARIIQEEEKRAEEPGGLQDSWMEAWREAVAEGVKVKVEGVHLEHTEQNTSWLAVHLGLLGKAIVDDLEQVRRELRWSYPPSFRVFSTYVKSYHRGVGQHLKKLEPQVTELKDLYNLLNWIINTYKSERIMGNPSLQHDMRDESIELQLEDDFLQQLKEKYCSKVKEEMKNVSDGVIRLENEDLWMKSKDPETEEDYLDSKFPMDIWTQVKGIVQNSRTIDAQLEKRVTSSCMEELKHFPKRFEAEFRRQCSAQPLWSEYQITYVNSFSALQQHLDGYRDACPLEVEAFNEEVKGLIARLLKDLEEQFKEDVKVYLRRMMTRKWLTNDDDFKQLYHRTELLSQHCDLMRPPHAQDFASRLHLHVMREYVGQLMKSNYSCKNRKHEKAASKIRAQTSKLRDVFKDMQSNHDWLHAVGDDLSNIITQKNKTDIKEHLQPLVEHYPDFSNSHLVAVLYFRGPMRGREHQLILQRLTELKKKLGGDVHRDQVLFAEMQVTVNTDCLSNLPFSCLSFLLPDN